MKRKKETQLHHSQYFFIKTHNVQQTKHHLRHNISRQVVF